ncbi:MAG: hypothetical protein SPH68_03560 [Candidatus Borkfalkiaceae bacterium]|nr:hypothetical protein [Clostridia bacterium]MDY6223223.1 hypothetical protein [Christensenellaceae bacterium]
MEGFENKEEENVRAINGNEADGKDAKAASAASDLPEKFKSVHALAEAYNALQAEFTRRCQRLRELEARADNLSRGDNEHGKDGSSEIKEGGKADAQAEEKTGISASINDAQSPAPALENATSESERREETRAEVAKADENAGADEKALFCAESESKEQDGVSEQTRLKIIADYLASLKKNAAPLIRGGAGTLSTPPAKPASIEEAGRMALRYFRA